jgi:hypothetical protein
LNLNGEVVLHGFVDALDYELDDLTVNEDVDFSHIYDEFNPELYVDTLLLFPRTYAGYGTWLENDSVDNLLVLTTPWHRIDTGYPPVLVPIPQEFNYYLTKDED